eukprot:gene37459-44934_t
MRKVDFAKPFHTIQIEREPALASDVTDMPNDPVQISTAAAPPPMAASSSFPAISLRKLEKTFGTGGERVHAL